MKLFVRVLIAGFILSHYYAFSSGAKWGTQRFFEIIAATGGISLVTACCIAVAVGLAKEQQSHWR